MQPVRTTCAQLLLLLVAGTLVGLAQSQTVCPAGRANKQSPIDIQDFKGACDNSIKLDLKRKGDAEIFTAAYASNTAFNQLTFPDKDGVKVVPASLYASDLSGNIFGYDMYEMRMHVPAEHNIETQGFDAEIQLLFRLREEFGVRAIKRAGISFLFKESDDKKISVNMVKFMMNGTLGKTQDGPVNGYIKDIIPSPLSYFTYEGSETAGDCLEDVLWYVIEKPIDISPQQVDELKANKTSTESRPTRALGSRTIKKGGVECEEQFIYFFSFVLLYAFINYFIFKLL